MSTHLTNVLMQQSLGPKSTMPTERPAGELLLALNEFNKYELYTGTGDSVQPLYSDGVGSSNISFIANQTNSNTLNGKFVYFDNETNEWKPAYAQASPNQNQHYTAQGFAITLSASGSQITTSGKLIIQFKLTDYQNRPVEAGKYYYLCQEPENAGLIQQNAPTTGIMQVVCQVLEVTENSTTLLLLNDLSQVADDVIVTTGDGSKYLGDDGQYHPMMIAGLAGRTTNCIGDYEVLDISFNNIGQGEDSFGYIKNGDITIENNIASNFSQTNYIISKYMVKGYTQYSLKIKQKFGQVDNVEPIFSTANKSCYMSIEDGLLNFVINGTTFKGVLTYSPDTYYYFNVSYNIESGYTISVSTDDSSYSNEIIIFDENNYIENLTIYLGVILQEESTTYTSGEIDLSNTGISHINEEESSTTYPLSELTTENVSTITVTFKGNGIIASGRAQNTNTLSAINEAVNISNSTIIANKDKSTLVWDTKDGLSAIDYEEVEYKRQYEDDGVNINKAVYAKDTNLVYKYTIVYPNFLHTNLIYSENNFNYIIKANIIGTPTITENAVASNFSSTSFIEQPNSFIPNDKHWKKVIKITTGQSVTSNAIFLGLNKNIYKGIKIGIDNSKFKVYIRQDDSNSSTQISNGSAGTYTVLANTTYYIKLEFTGTQYILSYSTTTDEDEAYTQDIIIDSTELISISDNRYGCDFANTDAFNGSIDFTGCYDEIDGEVVWVGFEENQNKGSVMIDFTSENASFHPNKLLNRNGFNFNIKFDTTGNLKLDRLLDARNYGGSKQTYYQVQGVDWQNFQTDEGFSQGIKISTYLGNKNTGTSNGAAYCSTIDDETYADLSYGGMNSCTPGFIYYNFEKPIKFDYVTFRNYKDANYIPTYFCMHVSNDMQTWYSVMPEDIDGYYADGAFTDIPVDKYAVYPNRTINAKFTVNCIMPDKNQYYKYFRLGLVGSTQYRALLSGLWVGLCYNGNSIDSSEQSAKELIFEKQNFINTDTSGINAQVVRKKVGTSYQVRFLDKLGYVNISQEDAIVDIENKKLVPNSTTIYTDERLQDVLDTQVLAYQTQCKQFLRNDRSYSQPIQGNPYADLDSTIRYIGTSDTGAKTTSYNCLMSDSSSYDFNNGTNASNYIITFLNKARVGYFYLQNNPTANYDPEQIKIYGSIEGGSFPNTTGTVSEPSGESAEAAIWERIDIINIVQAYNNGDFEKYAPTEKPNTYVSTANNTNHMSGTSTATNYGAYNIYIAATKAYRQYRIEIQRSSNKIIMSCIIPKDVWFDPFATPKDGEGINDPILADVEVYYPNSTLTISPNKSTLLEGIYSSQDGTSSVFELYRNDNNRFWNPNRARQYCRLYQAFQYPVNMSSVMIQHADNLNYAANLFQYYGTNLDSVATAPYSKENSLIKWTRVTSLIDKCDIPTILSTSQKETSIVLGRKDYGYHYFTALFARTINNSVYLNTFKNILPSVKMYNSRGSSYNNSPIYTKEYGWTNVAGEAGEVRNAACYSHPLLQPGDTFTVTPSYVVMKRGDSTKYYIDKQNVKDAVLENNTAVYRTTSLIGPQTLLYENRWMYKYTDSNDDIWYSDTQPTGNNAQVGSYMYKNIIPKYNTEYYTGIPLTATANEGSENGFTYFASTEYEDKIHAWNAFQNLTYNAETWVSGNNTYVSESGLPASEEQYLGFISPKPLCIEGYTIGGRAEYTSTPVHWEFQGSNDGDSWETIDNRKTKDIQDGTDTPVNLASGTSYYFKNKKSFTHFRWVIKQLKPSTEVYVRLKVWGLFVLNENPFKVKPIYELVRQNSQEETVKAYTFNEGTLNSFIDNNQTVYNDIKFTEPVLNEWAYEVTDESNTYWTKVAGESGAYVTESSMIYTDFDFIGEYGPALVDTWKYTGNINKKFSYTGQEMEDFVTDDLEPYNKYVYTGEIANQFKYTGKIEGWQYTGIQKDIYDVVPSFKLTLNRDDVRLIMKKTLIGMAYPVTDSENLSGISFYSYTFGDIAGSIVPQGTPLYSGPNDDEPIAIADGTNSYVFSSQPAESKYSYEYLYTRNNDIETGYNLTGDEQVYYDENLTKLVDNSEVDITQYTYTDTRETSTMHEFYHRITENLQQVTYNLGLKFDGSEYTSTIYAQDGDADIQTYESTELLRNAYDGIDEDLKNRVATLMQQQDIIKLNLTKSSYSWWTWNNIYENITKESQASLFKLGKIEYSGGIIKDIYKLYPWRVDECSSKSLIQYYSTDNIEDAPDKKELAAINFMSGALLDKVQDLSENQIYAVEFDNGLLGPRLSMSTSVTANSARTFSYTGWFYTNSATNATITLVQNGKTVRVYGTSVFLPKGTSINSNVAGNFYPTSV